jgi:hypothetical protein
MVRLGPGGSARAALEKKRGRFDLPHKAHSLKGGYSRAYICEDRANYAFRNGFKDLHDMA